MTVIVPLGDSVAAALDELADSIAAHWPASQGGPRVYPDPEQLGAVAPPALLFGPPSFTWTTLGPTPDEITLRVALVVAANDKTSGRLLSLLPLAAEAIETAPGAVVRTASPGTVGTDSGELPAFLLEVEIAL